jgi:hypothetical protein
MPSEEIFQIKVVLQDSKPPIWRRVLVPADMSLFDLHKIIQVAMGWTNRHLHQFVKDEQYYGLPSEDDWHPVIDERITQISDIAPSEGNMFVYEYDFGDGWGHTITVEKILAHDPHIHYPHCLKGKRACPPEDVGGIWGYEDFLAAMEDPDHIEHEAYLEWWGGPFDPDEFDVEETNRMLQDVDELEWWDDIWDI